MPETQGILTQLNHVLPSGIDPTRLATWRLMGGRTYDQVRADIAASLDGLNSEFLSVWGDLIYITTEDYLEYPNGGTVSDMYDITDVDRIESFKGDTVGHMIDLRVKTPGSVGGTERYFRDAREQQLIATVADLAQRGINTLEKNILTRAMTDNENALGSAGYEVGFASASASLTYTPPQHGGSTFASSHTHYVGFNVSTPLTLADTLDGLANTLQEHGHQAPYIAYVSAADVSTIRALTNFIRPTNDINLMIDRGGATSGNQFFTAGSVTATPKMGGRKVGWYDTPYGVVELRATARIPTTYAFMYKTAGINNPMNPIYLRVHPDVGFGFRIKEIPSYDTTYPVKKIDVEIEYGVSCGRDRTVGAAGFLVAGGVWVDPTIG